MDNCVMEGKDFSQLKKLGIKNGFSNLTTTFPSSLTPKTVPIVPLPPSCSPYFQSWPIN